MKLEPAIEVTDPNARSYAGRNRPLETEADLIAAAAPYGGGYRRQMAQVLDEDCHAYCSTCTWDTAEFFVSLNEGRLEMLITEMGYAKDTLPEYDPTIRL